MSTTITGNITADPELRFTASGTAVCNFTIATTPRKYDKATEEWIDGDTLFMRCTTWGTQAENMAEKLLKGSRVVATGNLEQHQYTDGEGNERTSVELSVDEIGSSLRYAEKAATPARRPAASSGKPASNGTAKKQYARSGQGSRSPQTVGGGR